MIDHTIISKAYRALAQAVASGELPAETLNPFRITSEGRQAVREALTALQAAGKLGNLLSGDLDELTVCLVGMGPLDRLINDPSVISIQVMAHDHVMVYRGGVWERASVSWATPGDLYEFARTLAERTGQAFDVEHPVVEASFSAPYAGRIQIDSTARTAARVTIHIRMGRRSRITLEQMLVDGCLSKAMYEFIREIAQRDVGLVIVGLPGTGKTTLLEACLEYCPPVPMVGLDDHSEFYPSHPMCTLYDVPAVRLRQALVEALRKNITRLVVAEVRGDETAEMLRYSGTVTIWTTLHASVGNAVLRLMALAQGAQNSPYASLPEDTVRRVIASAFPILIEAEKVTLGGRALFFIAEIAWLDETGTPRTVYKANTDGPRLTGFSEVMRPDVVLRAYRRRAWGSGTIPTLAAIVPLVSKFPDVGMTALSEYLRLHPNDSSAQALVKQLAHQDSVRGRVFAQLDAYETALSAAIESYQWAQALTITNQIRGDPLLATMSGQHERLTQLLGRFPPERLRRYANMVMQANEILGLTGANANLALVGLLKQIHDEPQAYPDDLKAAVLNGLRSIRANISQQEVE